MFSIKPFLFFCLFCLLMACSNQLFTATSNLQKSDKYIIPQNYIGWIKVSYEVPDASPLPIEGKYTVYLVPQSGIMKTSSKRQETLTDKYFYDTGNSLTEINESNSDEGGHIWGSYTQIEVNPITKEKVVSSSGFFVGNEMDFKEHGLRMEEKIGPIPTKIFERNEQYFYFKTSCF